MGLPLFLRVFLLAVAASLVSYVLLPMALVELAKLLALSLAITLLVPIVYPHIRGVRRGDMVAAVNPPQRGMMPPLQLPFLNFGGTYVALDNGRVGKRVHVSMPDGTPREAEVLAYAGFLQPARVRLLESEYSFNLL
jgi:hypothetical protein